MARIPNSWRESFLMDSFSVFITQIDLQINPDQYPVPVVSLRPMIGLWIKSVLPWLCADSLTTKPVAVPGLNNFS